MGGPKQYDKGGELAVNKRLNAQRSRLRVAIAAAVVTGGVVGMQPTNVWAYTSEDGTAEVHGFVENATFRRQGVGLSKSRNTVQIEGDKSFGDIGIFKNVTFHGEFRGTYDAVYDLNDDEFGDKAGGAINLQNTATNGFVPHGGGLPLSGGFNSTNPNAPNFNPNDGLVVLGNRTHGPGGGVTFGVPVRPCDKDNRGCIGDYLDYDSGDLRNPEFNERLDFLREAYVDFSMPINDFEEWSFRVGRQQVVWGRTDLFRVLDVLNPVDFSRNNIYDELEDIRYPMWMATAEYRMGPKLGFEDLNLQFVWNFDKFRPHNLGQGGTPNSILDAGSFFRGLKNCWDNGCTVSNFAANGTLATDFPSQVIGIRQANLPEWSLQNSQVGMKLEGVYDGIGFSLNALHYRSQLPSLRGGIPARNPFDLSVPLQSYDHLIAFDIDFPRVTLFGGSLDFYVDPLKSVVRAEVAYTQGEEFANTLRPRLFSESDVVRWVVGIDRNTFIPFLNKNRAFLISGQIFGQHLLDHELEQRQFGPAGIAEWEDNYIATLLVKGFYQNDRVSPQVIFAHDFRAAATAIAPSVDWLISNSLRLTVGANFKVGAGVKQFDDCRSCRPFPQLQDVTGNTNSQGLGGFEPLGRFRSGPIGMSRAEDEIQMVLRYRF